MKKIVLSQLLMGFAIVFSFAQEPILTVNSGHTGNVNDIVFTKDGKHLFSGSSDNVIKMWNAISGKEIKSFIGHEKGVNTILLTKDEKTLISSGADHNIILWDVMKGTQIKVLAEQDEFISCMALSSDERYLITGQSSWPEQPSDFILWDYKSGNKIRTFSGHQKSIKSLIFTPDNKKIISGSNDNTIRMWDVTSGKQLKLFRGHTGGINSVALSPDNKYVLSGSNDTSIKLWDINTGNEIKNITGHESVVKHVSFSKNGKYIVSGEYRYNKPSNVKLWETNSGKELKTCVGHKLSISKVKFYPDDKYFVSASEDGTMKLWEVNSGKNVRTYEGQTATVNSVNISANGNRLLSAGEDNSLKLWDAITGRFLKNISTHQDMVYHIAASSNKNYFATASYDKTIKLWDAQSGKEIRTFTGHGKIVQFVDFSPDSKQLLSSSADNSIKLWNVETGKLIKTLNGHSSWVERVVFSPDGKNAASASRDKTIIIWDLAAGTILKRLKGHSEKVYTVCFSPDGKQLISGGGNPYDQGNDLILWELATGKQLRHFKGHTRFVNHAIFSPDGKQIISASADSKINIWETSTGKLIKTLKGHTRAVYNVAFTPDHSKLISSGHDGSIRYWSYKTGKLVVTLYGFKNSADYVTTTPDRYFMSSKHGAKMIHYTIGNNTYNFDQFDMQYNRPDIIAKRIGIAQDDLIKSYNLAYVKRLKKMGFDKTKIDQLVNGDFKTSFKVPEVTLDENLPLYHKTEKKEFSFSFSAKDPGGSEIQRLFLKVNGVPVYGVKGKLLNNNEGSIQSEVKSLLLSKGKNVIELNVLSANGISSLTKKLEVTYESAHQKNDLYVISIGVSKYANSDMNLDYAAKDASDISLLMQKQKNQYNNVYTMEFLDKKALRENILKTKETLMNSKVDDEVLLFIAGHGVLDQHLDYYFATTNMDFENPSIKGLKYEDMEALLDGIPARKKLMLIDACHSGEVDKSAETGSINEKTNTKVVSGNVKFRRFKTKKNSANIGLQNSFELMKELFTDLRSGTGAMVISSASGAEFSYESSKWNNGVFTYSILEGIKTWKSDKNGDRKINISELRDYVTKRVVELTNGLQHPTSRKENLEYDFEIWSN